MSTDIKAIKMQTLLSAYNKLIAKRDELNQWLLNKHDSTYRLQVISDINALSIDINIAKKKIYNLKNDLPTLGFEIENIYLPKNNK